MNFDRYTIALLVKRRDAPELDEDEAVALQDAHLTHLADLHEAGVLLAAGPLAGEEIRGLLILGVETERARAVAEQDPAVRAGVFAISAFEWLVPAGAIRFSPTRFPRSLAEASG